MNVTRAASVAGKILVDGEFRLTDVEFRRIAAMTHEACGIRLIEAKATLVYSRLAKRVRTLGLSGFGAYCDLVESGADDGEKMTMLASLTTNVTRFYREPHHFEHLTKTVLPPLIEDAKRGRCVRIWSAACSSGEEPYTIAFCILGLMPDAARYDIRILATDIDPNMIAAGKAGLYDEALIAAVPSDLRRRWFAPADAAKGCAPGTYQVDTVPKSLIAFRPLNLIGHWPMKRNVQAIFCRNVVIYFDAETQSKIWDRMSNLLDPNGMLYIGHSERVTGPATSILQPDGTTTYRRLDRGHAA